MVFIRPTILRDGRDAAPITQRKLNLLRLEELRRNGDEPSRIDQAFEQLGYDSTVIAPEPEAEK